MSAHDEPSMTTVETVNLLLRMVNFLTEQTEKQADMLEATRKLCLTLGERVIRNEGPIMAAEIEAAMQPLRQSLMRVPEGSET